MREDPLISIEALRQQDLSAALTLQREIYPSFLVEEEAPFQSRMELETSYCLAAKRGEKLLGYLLAHGWKSQAPPPVGTLLSEGVASEVLFIHDLAVSSSTRGLKIGEKLITRVFELASHDGLRSAELIAVEGAENYWGKLGFVEGAVSDELREKIATYGDRARWMTSEIPTKR